MPIWCTRERIAILVGVAAAGLLLATAAIVAIGARSAAAAHPGPGLQIAVFEPEPVEIEAPPGKLDVLTHVENGFQGVPERPRMPGLGDVFGALVSYAAPPAEDVKPLEVRPAAPAPAVRRYAMATEPPPPIRPSAHPRARASFDCRRAATRAEAIVCSDPRLAAVDEDMGRALDRATLSGDPMVIMDDQRRWLAARERAARDGPAAVEHMYRLRLAELDRY